MFFYELSGCGFESRCCHLNYNFLIDGKNFLRTYDNTWKIVTGQGNDYTTGCLLDYPYFKEHYKLIAIVFK